MIVLDLSILNQKGTPMFNSDITANRPAAGIVGRIFIATDSPYGIFRDTGTAWDQVAGSGGSGTNIYNSNGTLDANRAVSSGGFNLTFEPQTTFSSSLTAATNLSSYSVLGNNTLSFAAGFSSTNIGSVYGANGAINSQTFLGNATFSQANLASAMVNVNKIDFGSGGHTITMTQSTAPGIRAMTGVQNQIQFTGSHNGTISHAAVSQNLGFFRESGSTRTLTITNAYSLLINPLDDYGAGFTFTNRWGIYQAGASDTNYFAASGSFGGGGSVFSFTGTNNNGKFFVFSSTSAGGGLSFAAPESSNSDIILSVRKTGAYNMTLSTIGQAWNFGNNAIFNFGVNNITQITTSEFQVQQVVKIFGTTENTRGIQFWEPGVAKRMFLYHTASVGDLILRGNDSNSSTSGTQLIKFFNSELSVLIGSTTTINSSVILQLDSVSKGFLTPRMTNAQRLAITSPSVGLEVYCTDAVEGKYIYKSTGWTFVI